MINHTSLAGRGLLVRTRQTSSSLQYGSNGAQTPFHTYGKQEESDKQQYKL